MGTMGQVLHKMCIHVGTIDPIRLQGPLGQLPDRLQSLLIYYII